MALLDVRNIFKTYADNSILEGVSLQINPGERIGLVGANGSGKTTLLKIITGEEESDRGEVFLGRGLSLGYLSQKPGFLSRSTLQEVLQGAVQEIFAIKDEMIRLEKEMSSSGSARTEAVLDPLMKRYGELSHLFEEKGGYLLEKRLQMIAFGLGFQEQDLQRRVESFSGGEKTRTQLAALLLREPDLLLLDEPTNSLDSESVEWLENYLNNWKGALLVVSHDRYFLDRVAGQIAVLENKALRSYRGNYSSCLRQRQIEKNTLEKAFKKREAAVNKDLAFIRTASADRRTKRQARSREKRLEKLSPLQKPGKGPSWHACFDFAGVGNQSVVSFEGVAKYFGSTRIFEDVSLEIKWGDRVAVVGPNGAGKTTLLRIITGEELVEAGLVKIGPESKIAYFDQEQRTLQGELTVLENIMEASAMGEAKARHYLGGYLFHGDEVFKKVQDLSGGEKSRLALAKMALEESNFLIMDEPTNHLDIWAIEELETALNNFPGTLLIVSHDRFFISRTATKILEVRNGRVKLFDGTYSEYREIKIKEQEDKTNALSPAEALAKQQRREKKEQEKARREELLAIRRKRRTLSSSLSETEEKIARGEDSINRLQEQLARPEVYDDFNQARKILEELGQVKNQVEVLYEEWERLAFLLEELPPEEEIQG